jgi:hypothetical protein
MLAVAVAASAQELPTGSPFAADPPAYGGAVSETAMPHAMDTYGTSDYVVAHYSPEDFEPLSDGVWDYYTNTTGWANRSGGTNSATCTGILLPQGALWTGVTYLMYDTDATFNVSLNIFKVDNAGHTSTSLYSKSTTGSGGQDQFYQDFAAAETVDNYPYRYTACYYSPVTSSALRYAGLMAWYKLQVSPAPATATFADVPVGAFGFQHIEALAASGITGGCGGGNFCPNDPLTRAQMAVFLAKALGLHFTS